jgi:hypothetical protein
MNAIIKKLDENKVIRNVGIIRHAKVYSVVDKRWYEELELWVNSISPHTKIRLDEDTQVILTQK